MWWLQLQFGIKETDEMRDKKNCQKMFQTEGALMDGWLPWLKDGGSAET